ncbi:unnamed protein product, partial [marine sediment metagenome]
FTERLFNWHIIESLIDTHTNLLPNNLGDRD